MTRRGFLKGLGVSSVGLCLTPANFGVASKLFERHLNLHNIHTGESFKGILQVGDSVDPLVQSELSRFLRDHYNGAVKEIDVTLMVLVSELQEKIGIQKPFDVISGYRSLETNDRLRRRASGVAKNSYHTKGMAVDIKSPKNLKLLRDYARQLKRGGVGYYSRSGFVHVDVRGYPVYWGA